MSLTPEQILYLQERIDETRVPSIHVANGICVGAATISVVLRFLARRSGGANLGKDDYCLFVAYVRSRGSKKPPPGPRKHSMLTVRIGLVCGFRRCARRCHTLWRRTPCHPHHRLQNLCDSKLYRPIYQNRADRIKVNLIQASFYVFGMACVKCSSKLSTTPLSCPDPYIGQQGFQRVDALLHKGLRS